MAETLLRPAHSPVPPAPVAENVRPVLPATPLRSRFLQALHGDIISVYLDRVVLAGFANFEQLEKFFNACSVTQVCRVLCIFTQLLHLN